VFDLLDSRVAMNGKEFASGKTPSDQVNPVQNLAVTSGDLPKQKASSSTSPPDATTGDDVAEMMGNLRLTTQESETFVFEDEGDEDLGCPAWAFVGMVLAPNPLHISTIRSALCPTWGNPKGLQIRTMGKNRFLAEFATEADLTRVKEGSPWTVGTHAVILSDFDPSLGSSDYRFEKLCLWVRILNLPFGLMNDNRGKQLAGRVGEVGKMDVDNQGRAWGDYLRFRATVNISEPLLRCVSVFSQKRQQLDHFSIMYERLPTFCFSCGWLGHSSIACPTPAERDADGLLPYHGPRLCVPDERKKKASGTFSGQGSFASDRGSRQSQDRGDPKVQPHSTSTKDQKDKNKSGEIASPVKPKQTRQRKPRGAALNISGDVADLVKGDKPRTAGQKRKEYRPKVPLQPPRLFFPLPRCPKGH
jgi:hypothetical protein